jgi:hypothetical protein
MTRRARIVRRIALVALAALPTGAWAVFSQADAVAVGDGPVRFAPLDVYVDAGDERLGAWQVELVPKPEFAGRVTIVGIGNGDAPFDDAPYYDQKALVDGERVIIADFETDRNELHKGKSRVAQVQLRITSDRDPDFDVKLHTAARHDGEAIDAIVEAILREPQRADDNDTTPENDG